MVLKRKEQPIKLKVREIPELPSLEDRNNGLKVQEGRDRLREW